MGNDCDPRIDLQHRPPWKYSNHRHLSDHKLPNIELQNTSPLVFPVYSNPYGCAFSGNGTAAFPGFSAQNFYQFSGPIPALNSTSLPLGLAAAQRSYLVFDRTGSQTNLIYSSVSPSLPNPNLVDRNMEPFGKNETEVSHEHGSSEMHEDTEEIDALLYSDTYEVLEEDEASTGHSPFEATESTGEVASSFVPAKRRRLDRELDASLTDTASSTVVHHSEIQADYNLEDGDESSFVKGCNRRVVGEESSVPTTAAIPKCNQAKRERIRETVGVLRRIIPGGEGKDAVAVLEEAIQYLRSLKQKAEAMGATHL